MDRTGGSIEALQEVLTWKAPVREVVPVDLRRHGASVAIDGRGRLEHGEPTRTQGPVLEVEFSNTRREVATLQVDANELDRERVRKRDEVASGAVERIDEGPRLTHQRPTIRRPRSCDRVAVPLEAMEIEPFEPFDPLRDERLELV